MVLVKRELEIPNFNESSSDYLEISREFNWVGAYAPTQLYLDPPMVWTINCSTSYCKKEKKLFSKSKQKYRGLIYILRRSNTGSVIMEYRSFKNNQKIITITHKMHYDDGSSLMGYCWRTYMYQGTKKRQMFYGTTTNLLILICSRVG
jgi:hypothetical protein